MQVAPRPASHRAGTVHFRTSLIVAELQRKLYLFRSGSLCLEPVLDNLSASSFSQTANTSPRRGGDARVNELSCGVSCLLAGSPDRSIAGREASGFRGRSRRRRGRERRGCCRRTSCPRPPGGSGSRGLDPRGPRQGDRTLRGSTCRGVAPHSGDRVRSSSACNGTRGLEVPRRWGSCWLAGLRCCDLPRV